MVNTINFRQNKSKALSYAGYIIAGNNRTLVSHTGISRLNGTLCFGGKFLFVSFMI